MENELNQTLSNETTSISFENILDKCIQINIFRAFERHIQCALVQNSISFIYGTALWM
jgi:hypothetical protein